MVLRTVDDAFGGEGGFGLVLIEGAVEDEG
jgi:hypothetical protein